MLCKRSKSHHSNVVHHTLSVIEWQYTHYIRSHYFVAYMLGIWSGRPILFRVSTFWLPRKWVFGVRENLKLTCLYYTCSDVYCLYHKGGMLQWPHPLLSKWLHLQRRTRNLHQRSLDPPMGDKECRSTNRGKIGRMFSFSLVSLRSKLYTWMVQNLNALWWSDRNSGRVKRENFKYPFSHFPCLFYSLGENCSSDCFLMV